MSLSGSDDNSVDSNSPEVGYTIGGVAKSIAYSPFRVVSAIMPTRGAVEDDTEPLGGSADVPEKSAEELPPDANVETGVLSDSPADVPAIERVTENTDKTDLTLQQLLSTMSLTDRALFITTLSDAEKAEIYASYDAETGSVPATEGESVRVLKNMIFPPEESATTTNIDKADNTSSLKVAVGVLGVSTVALLASTIALTVKNNGTAAPVTTESVVMPVDTFQATDFVALKEGSIFLNAEDNVCAGAKLAVDNKLCADFDVAPPQAGGNVTKGYVGDLDVGDLAPNTNNYWSSAMCPVNVHWHLGTEHYSYGQYDENGDGPHGTAPRPDWADRDLAGKDVRGGFRCHHYDESDEKFTKPYEWKYCTNMEVGETYEVHWPHSAAGDCGTVNQYQTPFYDGVFCNLDLATFQAIAQDPQNIASAVGVHGQVFTIVNDDSYYYPDMIRGMVVDKARNMGSDIHYYTGSTTGTSRDNEMCSQYAPITWQVDRQCHMISASSFDKMCYDMLLQRDDMSDDVYPHGSRELVKDSLVANNAYYPDSPPVRKLRA